MNASAPAEMNEWMKEWMNACEREKGVWIYCPLPIFSFFQPRPWDSEYCSVARHTLSPLLSSQSTSVPQFFSTPSIHPSLLLPWSLSVLLCFPAILRCVSFSVFLPSFLSFFFFSLFSFHPSLVFHSMIPAITHGWRSRNWTAPSPLHPHHPKLHSIPSHHLLILIILSSIPSSSHPPILSSSHIPFHS